MMWFARPKLVVCLWLWLTYSLRVVAGSWGFDDATVTIAGKKSGVSDGLKQKYVFESN